MFFLKDIIHFTFIVKTIIAINPTVQYPLRTAAAKGRLYCANASLRAQYSKIPTFQHSNWSETPNLKIVLEFESDLIYNNTSTHLVKFSGRIATARTGKMICVRCTFILQPYPCFSFCLRSIRVPQCHTAFH